MIPRSVYGTAVKAIGPNAFANYSFKTVVIPEGVEKIG